MLSVVYVYNKWLEAVPIHFAHGARKSSDKLVSAVVYGTGMSVVVCGMVMSVVGSVVGMFMEGISVVVYGTGMWWACQWWVCQWWACQ